MHMERSVHSEAAAGMVCDLKRGNPFLLLSVFPSLHVLLQDSHFLPASVSGTPGAGGASAPLGRDPEREGPDRRTRGGRQLLQL